MVLDMNLLACSDQHKPMAWSCTLQCKSEKADIETQTEQNSKPINPMNSMTCTSIKLIHMPI